MSDQQRRRIPKALRERFRLERALGRGGMGAVFLGQMPGTDRPCALKLVGSHDPRHEKRILREARLMSQVEHPHLIRVLDMGVEDGMPWLAMDFVDGATMSRMRRDGRLEEPDTLARWISEASGALAALHEAGILHRDIKLGNMMVDKDRRAVLMDLGLAVNEEATRITRTGHLVGTITYLAPELFQGQGASEASDWYSMGVCLYYALEGKRPYEPKQIHEFAAQRRFEPPPPMAGPHKDHPAARAAEALMHPDPRLRLQSIDDLLEVLDGAPWKPSVSHTLTSLDVPAPGGEHGDMAGRTWLADHARGIGLGMGVALALGATGLLLSRHAGPPAAPSPSPAPLATQPPTQPAAPTRPDPSRAPGSDTLRWAVRQSARARRRVGAARARALGWARAQLDRLDPQDPWVAAARVELMWAAPDRVPSGVDSAWRDAFLRAVADLLEHLPSGKPPAELRQAAAQAQERQVQAVAAPDSLTSLPAPFRTASPEGDRLWALRTYGPGELPEERLDGWLAFGADLPEGFDLDRWAGDLRGHPLVLLAQTRSWKRRDQALPERMVQRLDRARWDPPRGSSPARLWLWAEGRVAHAWGSAWLQRPSPRVRAVAELDAVLTRLEQEGATRVAALVRGEQAAARSLVAGGEGQRRKGPLGAQRAALTHLVRDLDAEPSPGALEVVLRIRAGELLSFAHHLMLDCPAVRREQAALRAAVDWDQLAELGGGGLLEAAAPWTEAYGSTLRGMCKVTRDSRGTPLQVLDYVDGWPE